MYIAFVIILEIIVGNFDRLVMSDDGSPPASHKETTALCQDRTYSIIPQRPTQYIFSYQGQSFYVETVILWRQGTKELHPISSTQNHHHLPHFFRSSKYSNRTNLPSIFNPIRVCLCPNCIVPSISYHGLYIYLVIQKTNSRYPLSLLLHSDLLGPRIDSQSSLNSPSYFISHKYVSKITSITEGSTTFTNNDKSIPFDLNFSTINSA